MPVRICEKEYPLFGGEERPCELFLDLIKAARVRKVHKGHESHLTSFFLVQRLPDTISQMLTVLKENTVNT